jgi:hypothetical protein
MLARSFRPASTALAAAVAVGAFGLVGCGEKTIKTDEVESTIVTQFAAQGVKLTEVKCDDGVKAEVDAKISCTALNPSQTTLNLEGKVTKVDGDKGSFQVKAVSGVAKGSVVAAQAQALLEKQVGQKAKGLTCPTEVPIPTKPTVTCELTTQDDTKFDTTVTIDANSKIDVEVADKAK